MRKEITMVKYAREEGLSHVLSKIRRDKKLEANHQVPFGSPEQLWIKGTSSRRKSRINITVKETKKN